MIAFKPTTVGGSTRTTIAKGGVGSLLGTLTRSRNSQGCVAEALWDHAGRLQETLVEHLIQTKGDRHAARKPTGRYLEKVPGGHHTH